MARQHSEDHGIVILHIKHSTIYRYRQPVILEPHRLMLRPRENRDMRLLSHHIAISPSATASWAQDAFGNTVTTEHFHAPADLLSISSHAMMELLARQWNDTDASACAASHPFQYSQAEWADLSAMAVPRYADPAERLLDWARGFVRSQPTGSLALLQDLCAGISTAIAYQSREEEGTQTPLQTLARGWGSCRDFAVLFVEAARCLQFAARIVSGYLYDAKGASVSTSNSTHAWAEIYVPDAGWITFDPTNRSSGGLVLIPVAVAPDIAQVMPVAGSFNGSSAAYIGMSVDVSIRAENT